MSAKSAAIKARSRARSYVIAVPDDLEEWVVTPRRPMSDEEFWEFCVRNPMLRLELTSEGQMIIMMPVGGEGSSRNFLLTGRLGAWTEIDGTGIGFDSSAGFRLPNKATRSPDASWVKRERWEALIDKQREKFAPICPDFVVELRSKTDRLKKLQAKLDEYIANGAQLGWLIDPKEKKVHIYRPDTPVEILDQPQEVSGEPLLKGFTLKLAGIID